MLNQMAGRRANWALATIDSGGKPLACLEVGGELYPLGPSLARVCTNGVSTVIDLLADWDRPRIALEAAAKAVDAQEAVAEGRRLSPLLFPGKVLCAGANYYGHLAEM